MTRQDYDEERAHEERETRAQGRPNYDRVAHHLAVAQDARTACRVCGGAGTVFHRKRYHPEGRQVPCTACRPEAVASPEDLPEKVARFREMNKTDFVVFGSVQRHGGIYYRLKSGARFVFGKKDTVALRRLSTPNWDL